MTTSELSTYMKYRHYDFNAIKDTYLDILKDLPSTNLSIVEYGCGFGGFSVPLLSNLTALNKNFSFLGIDNSVEMVDAFKAQIKERNFETYNIDNLILDLNLDFPKNINMNCALIAGLQHKLKNWNVFIDRLIKRLDDNGYIILVFRIDDWIKTIFNPNFFSLKNDTGLMLIHKYLRTAKDLLGKPSDNLIDHLSLIYDSSKSQSLLEDKGMRLMKKYYCQWAKIIDFTFIKDLLLDSDHTSFSEISIQERCYILNKLNKDLSPELIGQNTINYTFEFNLFKKQV